jgi:hypothetical protein
MHRQTKKVVCCTVLKKYVKKTHSALYVSGSCDRRAVNPAGNLRPRRFLDPSAGYY